MGRIEGKVAIVTGAARGMGEVHARRLVEEGARVVVTDVLDEQGRAVAEALGENAMYLHLDVRDEAGWASIVTQAQRRFGQLDILVNNAGLGGGNNSFLDIDMEQWRSTLDVSLTGTFLGLQAGVRAMRDRGGSIINVSSIWGQRGIPMIHAYVAAKFAVTGLTKSVAIEVAQQGIRVNSIHPGMIETPMTKDRDPSFMRIPMDRRGSCDEVSSLVLFLASDESSYCTGSEFTVDGGVTAGVPLDMSPLAQ